MTENSTRGVLDLRRGVAITADRETDADHAIRTVSVVGYDAGACVGDHRTIVTERGCPVARMSPVWIMSPSLLMGFRDCTIPVKTEITQRDTTALVGNETTSKIRYFAGASLYWSDSMAV